MSSAAEEHIRRRIREHGPVTFAEFMEAALYGVDGYYTSRNRIGAHGDYFTAPHAHPAFGSLIAVQLRAFWDSLGRPKTFTAVELGAGDGLLASDITTYVRRLDAQFATALSYLAFDRTVPVAPLYPVVAVAPDSIEAHERAGESFLHAGLPSGAVGCVLSNELLDAMPVHRFVVRSGLVQELFVGLDGIHFVEVPGVPSVSEIEERVGPYASSLPDGFKGEVNAGIGRWARQVSRILARGFVLTVDYGHKRAALYSPERRNGTLRTYYRHTLGQDPFRRVGAQDMTTHVDFTAVDEALAAEGFDRAWHTTQREFLLSLGLDSFIRRCHEACTTQSEADTNRAGMLHLTKPEGMGAFRVAIHSRGVTKAFAVGRQSSGAPECLPVPLLRDFKPRLSVSADLQPQTAAGQPPSWEELFSDRREGGAGAWTS